MNKIPFPIVLSFGLAAAFALPFSPFASSASAQTPVLHPAPRAQPPVQTMRTIDVDVTDADKTGPPRIAKLTVSVETGGSWSRVTSHAGSEVYRVGVRVENDRLWLELHRTDGNGVAPEIDVSSCITIALGKRAVVSRVQRANGSATEVAVVSR